MFTISVIILLVTNCLLLNGILILMRRNRAKQDQFETVTFNQLCSANQRLGALIAMQGYSLDDVERFAKLALQPPAPPEGAQAHPKLETEPTA